MKTAMSGMSGCHKSIIEMPMGNNRVAVLQKEGFTIEMFQYADA
jgi:hypothetical protein